jgi:hypothetical protein
MSLLRAALNISRDVAKARETDRLLKEAQARKKAEEDQAKAAAAQRAKNAAAPAQPLMTKPAAAPLSVYGLPKIAPPPPPAKIALPPPPPAKIALPLPPKPIVKEEAVKAMAPGQAGGMIGATSKEMGAKVGVIGQGIAPNIIPPSNNTMFGNIAVKEGGAPSPAYAKMAVPAPAGAPPSQYGVAKTPTGPPAAPGTYGTAKTPTGPPPPPGQYGVAKEVPKISGDVMMEQIKKGELPTGIPKPMIKEETVKAMAPGQAGGMIGAASKEMGGKVEAIGQGLAPKAMVMSKEVPVLPPKDIGAPTSKIAEDKKGNMPEAISKKVDPEVKKIVDSFGKPERSEVEQKKMEAMKKFGVEPPKDAKDMEDLRKGIYRPDGKEVPGTGLLESLQKDLSALQSMLGKMMGGKSGYTSGEMFGSTNSLILIALVVAIIFASRR